MAYRKRHRGTTYQRGYGPAHRKLKDQWRPTVEEGHAYCHATLCLMPTRWIQPGTAWHLGHTPDRTGWTGPEHQRCGAADGARRGNSRRGQTRGWITSRRW